MSRPDHDAFPIVTARTYAGGASAALSEADAFWTHDEPRTDRCLAEALAALDEARAATLKAIDQRRPARAVNLRRSDPVGRIMGTAVAASLFLTPVALLVFGRF